MLILSLLLFVLGLGMAKKAEQYVSMEGKELIGTRAQEWEVKDWFNSKPIRLENLKGKVVLVRFWTAAGCPFCSASAPALNEFYEKYHDQGLAVIGFYHHKSSGPLDPEDVGRYGREFGFKFPVAIDYNWKTLKNWWLDEGCPAQHQIFFERVFERCFESGQRHNRASQEK